MISAISTLWCSSAMMTSAGFCKIKINYFFIIIVFFLYLLILSLKIVLENEFDEFDDFGMKMEISSMMAASSGF
jgi:hypothetical protein